jgi:cephalosporin hydroxylase
MNWPTQRDILELKKYVNSEKSKDMEALKKDSKQWIRTGWANKISYENTWLGVPIIQLPEDIIIMQELIFNVKPDIVIESGIAHGGSLILYSSLLELLGNGKVIGVDIEIRKHNREAIEKHPMSKRIILIEGSSTDPAVIKKVAEQIEPDSTVFSNHTKAHVLEELKAYSDFVTSGSYIAVFDTIMPDLVGVPGSQKSWDKDNPMEAIKEFLKTNSDFEIDKAYNKLFVSSCPNGFLRRE